MVGGCRIVEGGRHLEVSPTLHPTSTIPAKRQNLPHIQRLLSRKPFPSPLSCPAQPVSLLARRSCRLCRALPGPCECGLCSPDQVLLTRSTKKGNRPAVFFNPSPKLLSRYALLRRRKSHSDGLAKIIVIGSTPPSVTCNRFQRTSPHTARTSRLMSSQEATVSPFSPDRH